MHTTSSFAIAVAALATAACNPLFSPVTPPTAAADGTQVRIEAIRTGSAELAPLVTFSQLVVRTRAGADARLERALLTGLTRAECSGGSPAVAVAVDGDKPAKLPASIGGERALVLWFGPSPEQSLEAPTALDLAFDDDGRRTCVRTVLGPPDAWERPQLSGDFALSAGVPLRTLGDIAPIYVLEERGGALVGSVEYSAGIRLGVARCAECADTVALLPGLVVAATFYLAPWRRSTFALKVSYGSTVELMHHPSDPSGSDPHVREWYQVPEIGLQWDWLTPPRGSPVRLRGRDFNAMGLELFEQVWVPTLHADLPAAVMGIALVGRVAF